MTKPITKGPRHAALKILTRVEAGDAYADALLEKELPLLLGPDRALAMEIVMGVLRWQIKIDWIIDSFSKIKTKKLEHKVLNALRIGVYQLLFLQKIPASAAVNETVNLVKPLGSKRAGFVNSVLRAIEANRNAIMFPALKREPVKYISVLFSHPEWLSERWIRRYGFKEAMELCQADLRVPPLAIRTNTLVMSRDGLMAELTKDGFEVEKTRFSPEGVVVVKKPEGASLSPRDRRYYIQDEASQLVSHLLGPRPGESILDACSAPGGKTSHIAMLMKNKGLIYALERHESRLKTLREVLARYDVTIAKPLCADAAGRLTFQTELFSNGSGSRFDGLFDAVLLDAPCTGLGVLRRNPDIKSRITPEDIERLSLLQKELLENLGKRVRKGGRLVYSTCSLEPEETDDVVEGFLKSHKDFALEDPMDYLPEGCAPLVERPGYLRTYPHRHQTDGFFAARLKAV